MRDTCKHFATTFHSVARANVYMLVTVPEPKRGGQPAVFQCVNPLSLVFVTSPSLLFRVSAGSRVKDDKDFLKVKPKLCALFEQEFKLFSFDCTSTSYVWRLSLMQVTDLLIAEEELEAMRMVYPQQSSSHVPVIADSHTNVSTASTSSDTTTAAPRNNLLPPFQLQPANISLSSGANDDIDVAKSSRSKGKFKQRRDHSPTDDSDLELDFDNLDVFPDEEKEDAIDNTDTPRPMFPDPSSPSSPSLFVLQRKGGDGDNGKVKLAADGRWITNYEYKRLQKMASNNKLMRSMGIPDAVKALVGEKPPASLQRSRVPTAVPAGPPSRFPPARASKQHVKS